MTVRLQDEQTRPVPPRRASLAEIEAAVWQELGQAVQQRDHEWRQLVLATHDDGGPDARTVVLREVQSARRVLTLYSDTRARKVQQIERDPRATVVCWSPRLGWQVRLRCRAEVATDGLNVTARWARLRHSTAAQDYLSVSAPGSALPALAVADGPSDPLMAGCNRAHFAVLSLHVESVDWLELHPQGHRRALFDAQGAQWLVP